MSSIFSLFGFSGDDVERISPFALSKCLEHFPDSIEYIDMEKAEIFGFYVERDCQPYRLIVRFPRGSDGYLYYVFWFTSNYLYTSSQKIGTGNYHDADSLIFMKFNIRLSKKGKLIFEKEIEKIESVKAAR